MTYVDALYDKSRDVILVSERVNGKRLITEHRPDYNFYIPDPQGRHRSITGERVLEIRCKNSTEFRKNLAMNSHKTTYESDIKPVNKLLSKHYNGVDTPRLHTAFFDLEVGFDPLRGFSSPREAFMPITAIGVYLEWLETMVCLAVPPPTLTWSQAQKISEQIPNVVLFETEQGLLQAFLDLIEDADVLSGWNSEGFDIPYTVNRIRQVLGKNETRRLCLWDQLPREREYESYGSEQQTYDLVGRIHLDYLQLYRKYNYEERHSYRLDYIGDVELGERKVAYDGSLDKLYHHDFKKFLEYNIQDTVLLYKLDRKLQFIDLANTIAHDNTVLIPTVMGAVATTEQAIINEAHRRGMVVPDRNREEAEDNQAAGAYVAFPKKGYHEWIGSMDINSLYPSVFRALNMAPETLVGQVRTNYTDAEIERKTSGSWTDDRGQVRKKVSFADAWTGKFGTTEFELVQARDTERLLYLDMNDGNTLECTGADIYNLVFNSDQPWNISANGTIFRTDIQGVVPGLLERWYSERKELQAKKKAAETEADKAYWDKRQLVKKINLNSLYGAILNKGCRFADFRIGQSTTLTGRRIARHMIAKTNELLTGEYDHEGECIVYGDTDSVYFTATPVLPAGTELDLGGAVKLYDNISERVSDTFPEYLNRDFNVPLESGKVLKAGREVVGRAGLFITKKRYAINCWDIEGYQPEGGKLKVMGMDIKRSDTPEFIQDFLEEVLGEALNGQAEEQVLEKIRDFKKQFKDLTPWNKGMPKRVNNLTAYGEKLKKLRGGRADPRKLSKKVQSQLDDENNMIPGHVLASLNWNELRRANSDNYSMEITDGAKVIVCRLRANPMGYSSIAYPTDELHLPEWFKTLPFDEALMEEIVLDKKIDNVLGQMGWDLGKIHESESLREFFEF